MVRRRGNRTSGRHLAHWAVMGGSGVLGLIIAIAAYVYFASERIIHHKYEAPLIEIDVPTEATAIAEGERLAHISGCFGCHGDRLQGKVWDDDVMWGRLNAPNIPQVAREYSPAELARVIRSGVRPNGEGVISMPSPMFYHLSDNAIGRLVAFLRSAPVSDGLGYEFQPGWARRWFLAIGSDRLRPEVIAGSDPRMPEPPPGDTIALGAYIAQTACTECHGSKLQGDWGPDLVIAVSYTAAEFARFMSTGVATGGRELPVMSGVARGRFSYFADSEVAALGAFLRDRAARMGH